MSRVMRLSDLIMQIEYFDTIYLNGTVYTANIIEASKNPLVHIDFIDTDIAEHISSNGKELVIKAIYYVTTI